MGGVRSSCGGVGDGGRDVNGAGKRDHKVRPVAKCDICDGSHFTLGRNRQLWEGLDGRKAWAVKGEGDWVRGKVARDNRENIYRDVLVEYSMG